MKVTVCFGDTRVVVPCRGGELLVRELIDLSVNRYRKATGKPSDYWVSVHTLKSVRDGGILDLDDKLSDVVDDKEQIIVEFEEQGGPTPPQGGDGSSGSSEGSASPELFQNRKNGKPYRHGDHGGSNTVVVTETDLNASGGGDGLQVLSVRRGSEPNLPGLLVQQPGGGQDLVMLMEHDPDAQENRPKAKRILSSQLPKALAHAKAQKNRDSSDEEDRGFSRFARDSSRQSISSQNILRWASAAQDTEEKFTEISNRKEPLGQSRSPALEEDGAETQLVVLKNEEGPLGIHVVPNYDSLNRQSALVIQSIEPKGRIDRDGRFAPNDVIAEINGTSILGAPFSKSQEIFRRGLLSKQIVLKLLKNAGNTYFSDSDSPEAEAHHMNRSVDSPAHATAPSSDDSKSPPPLPSAASLATPEAAATAMQSSKVPPRHSSSSAEGENSLGKKKPPPPVRSPSTALSTGTNLLSTNTRRLGKKLSIDLLKGPEGLGFSVTTRDNPSGGPAPIYVKNILPKGAAITDRRLRSGDRLLEVNKQDMTGKSQEEAVSILRSTKRGSVVHLIVSRHESSDTNSLPRQLLPVTTPTAELLYAKCRAMRPISLIVDHIMEGSEPDSSSSSSGESTPVKSAGDEGAQYGKGEVLVFDIPLNETGSAGLGVSVKGKTTNIGGVSRDAGIFIKTVIHGGAASKDGRLQVNDQLVEVNGEALTDKSNGQAMDRLRMAMQAEGPLPGHIKLSVLRKSPLGSASLSQSAGSPLSSPAPSYASSQVEPALQPSSPDSSSAVLKNPMTNQRNPVVDRLTGAAAAAGKPPSFRTPSISGESRLTDEGDGAEAGIFLPVSTLPGSQPAVGTSVMIEDDSQPGKVIMRERHSSSSKSRPFSTIGGVGIVEKEEEKVRNSVRSEEGARAPSPPVWVKDWENPDDAEVGYFDREGVGRQSFSEKRKNASNRSREFVEKSKQIRAELDQKKQAENKTNEAAEISQMKSEGDFDDPSLAIAASLHRASSADSLLGHSNPIYGLHGLHGYWRETSGGGVGPTLGLAKSSSYESLQAVAGAGVGGDQEEDYDSEEEGEGSGRSRRKVRRGRGCNDSFRAAVDRSYDKEPTAIMDTGPSPKPTPSERKVAEESDSGSNVTPSNHSSSALDTNSLDKKKKKPSKFLGMFRFGKNRKSLEDRLPKASAQELHKLKEHDRNRTLPSSGDKSKPIDRDQLLDQYKRMQESRSSSQPPPHRDARDAALVGETPAVAIGNNVARNYGSLTKPSSGQHISQAPLPPLPHHPPQQERSDPQSMLSASLPAPAQVAHPSPSSTPPLVSMSRSERIQYLRGEHQRKHAERSGRYPGDERQEALERRLQDNEWAANTQGRFGSGSERTDQYSAGSGKNAHQLYGDANFNKLYAGPTGTQPASLPSENTQPQSTRLLPGTNSTYDSHAHRQPPQPPQPPQPYVPKQPMYAAVDQAPRFVHHQKQQSLDGYSPRYPPAGKPPSYHQALPAHESVYRGAPAGRSGGPVAPSGRPAGAPPAARYLAQIHHQRGGSYDITPAGVGTGYGGDFDDPRFAYTENSIYAQIKKPPKQPAQDRMSSAQV